MNYLRLTLHDGPAVVFAIEHIAVYLPEKDGGTIIVTADGLRYHVREAFEDVDKALVSDE